ncbi:MAG: DMT family transporter [Campylobacterales bacterium]|nr:DMT family transporter [Campylobacterales bacterium]
MIITKEQKAVVYMFSATLLFSVVALCAKLVSHLGALEITFFRNAVGILFLLAFFNYAKTKRFNTKKLGLLLFRGFIGTVALIAFFYNVSAVSLADAMTFTKTEPLFSALLAFWLMKERLDKAKVAAIVIGFLGIAVIGYDRGASLAYANVVGLIAGFCSALAYTTIRHIRDDFDHRFVVLSFMSFGTILPLVLMSLSSLTGEGEIIRSFVAPKSHEIWILIAIGALSAAGQVLMTKAYFAAKAGVVSTVSYFSILFGVIFGLLIGDALPNLVVFGGMGLIIVSGILIAKK